MNLLRIRLKEKNGGYMKVLVIGSSAAAVSFAETFRKNSDSEIMLITQEEVMPYFRPSLSHMILNDSKEDRFFLKADDFYKSNNIEVLLGKKVVDINAQDRSVTIEGGHKESYDKLVFAVGSYNFMPPTKGIEKEGVFNLKYFEDLEKINVYAKDKQNITIIGGGLLGIEAAWAFHNAGKKVTILEFIPRLMARQLCEEASTILENELKRIGINVMTGKSTKEIQGEERVEHIVLESGEVIPTDLLFFSVGVRPNVELAQKAGLKVDRGIVVDDFMKTSDDNIYAIGDCSQIGQMVPGIWPLAMQMGKIAAGHLTGKVNSLTINPPIAILKALDIGVYSAGDISKSDDEVVLRKGNDFKYFSFENNVLTGVNLIGDTKLSSKVPKMLAQGLSKNEVEQMIKEF